MSQACRKLVACDKVLPCKSAFKSIPRFVGEISFFNRRCLRRRRSSFLNSLVSVVAVERVVSVVAVVAVVSSTQENVQNMWMYVYH